jgi:hypothetical protein
MVFLGARTPVRFVQLGEIIVFGGCTTFAQERWQAPAATGLRTPERGEAPMLACTAQELQRLVVAGHADGPAGAPVRNICGGFLRVVLELDGDRPRLLLRHHGADGGMLHEEVREGP